MGETEAASAGPLGQEDGEQGGAARGILFVEETRETRPGGWEGGGIGQPLSTETLSVWDQSHVVGCQALPIVRTRMSPGGAR